MNMVGEMLDETWQFVVINWQSIIITLGGGLLFFILSYYGLRRYVMSAERERLIQAKNSMLDIVESRIISKHRISKTEINRLLKAIDREHSVDLSAVVSPSSILEDLQLRFEKSHHLDSSQKEEYCKKLEEFSEEISKEEKTVTVPVRYSEIIDTLTEDIESNKSKEALDTLELLKKKMREREETVMYRPIGGLFVSTLMRDPRLIGLLIFYLLIFYIVSK
jgi:hypothetical protein